MRQNAGRSGIDQWNFVMSPVAASQDESGEYIRGHHLLSPLTSITEDVLLPLIIDVIFEELIISSNR